MANISTLGIGSGLNIRSLVDQLVAAETQPAANRLNVKEARLQAELSAFGSLKSALSQLQNSLTSLTNVGTELTATSSDVNAISASAGSSAIPGSYSVEVSPRASSHSLASKSYTDSSDVVGTGTLTITFGTTDYDPETDTYNGFTANSEKTPRVLTIDSENNTLAGIKDALNEADIGVNAVIVNDGAGYRLLLSSTESGLENSLKISVTDDAGSGLTDLAFDASATNLEQTVAAADAQLTINGLAVSSNSNTVTEAIPGVSLSLNETTDGNPVVIDVAKDTNAVNSALNSFIAQYNALITQIQSLTDYNADTQVASLLIGDSSVRQLESQLRNGLFETVEGASGDYRYLVDLGVTTDENGKLTFDSDVLSTALETDFDAVVNFINGFGDKLDANISTYLGTEGILEIREQGMQDGIDDIGDQRIALELRAATIEQRYLKQFTALDTLLGQLQNTSSFLTQQLSNLPNSLKSES